MHRWRASCTRSSEDPALWLRSPSGSCAGMGGKEHKSDMNQAGNQVRNQARSIAEAVCMQALRKPDERAVVDRNGPVTYIQLWKNTARCARALKELGIRDGGRVVMECTQDVLFLTVDLACQLTGAVFVGVERRIAPGRLREIVRQTEPALLLTSKTVDISTAADRQSPVMKHMTVKEFTDLLKEGNGAQTEDPLFREPSSDCLREAEELASRTNPDTVAQILFSTGTTGKTKGAVLTNRANVANAQNIIDGVRMEADAVEMVPLPINHAHGLRTCYAHFLNGSCVLIANGITFPRVLFDMMEKYGANALDLSPSAAQMLMTASSGRLKEMASSIRYVEVGTAFLPETTKELLREFFPGARLYNFYGSSESGRTCSLEFSGEMNRPGCIGLPVPNARFAVLDPEGRIMESDAEHTGLLACAGPMNMTGYWRSPELTEETLKDGYLLTADLSYIDKDGYIYVLGRQDDVIVYKGIKIAPEEIEEAAMGCGLIADCACIPVKDETAGQVPKLFVVPKEPDSWRAEALFVYLKLHIDDNRMPRTIERIDAIPRTYNGKILRRELAARAEGSSPAPA